MVSVSELKTADNLVYGAEETLKLLRKGQIKAVLLSANCNPQTKEDIERLCKLGNIECTTLTQSSEDVGNLCHKPFPISVVGIKA